MLVSMLENIPRQILGMDIESPQSDTTNNTSGADTENANREQGPNEGNRNETDEQGNVATEDESSQDSQVPPDEHDVCFNFVFFLVSFIFNRNFFF